MSSRRSVWLALLATLVTFLASPSSIVYAKRFIVDDSETDRIIYSSNKWNVGNTCRDCYAHPDQTRAYGGTWHDVTNDFDDIYFTFNFTGTAIEAHYIAIDFNSSWTTNTHVVYSIDGARSGSASREPINQADYLYNQTLFRISGLEDTKHILKVGLRKPSVLLLDYLAYESGGDEASTGANTDATLPFPKAVDHNGGPDTNRGPPSLVPNLDVGSAQPSVDTGAIIGVAISCAVFVFLIVAIWVLSVLRRRAREFEENLNASRAQSSPFLRPPPDCKSRSVPKSKTRGYTEKNAFFNLLLPRESPPPEYTALSNTSSPLIRSTLPLHGGRV